MPEDFEGICQYRYPGARRLAVNYGIMVQDVNCFQTRVFRFNGHYKFVLGAGVLPACLRQSGKVKTVTNNLCIVRIKVSF
ncbi:MAG TPA: hypothetical protein DDW27_12165 [Bacteroidales bacterium]|nr:hypothetical protein [Bacteroidales bacterium]